MYVCMYVAPEAWILIRRCGQNILQRLDTAVSEAVAIICRTARWKRRGHRLLGVRALSGKAWGRRLLGPCLSLLHGPALRSPRLGSRRRRRCG